VHSHFLSIVLQVRAIALSLLYSAASAGQNSLISIAVSIHVCQCQQTDRGAVCDATVRDSQQPHDSGGSRADLYILIAMRGSIMFKIEARVDYATIKDFALKFHDLLNIQNG